MKRRFKCLRPGAFHNNLAGVRLAAGDFAGALRDYNRAIELDDGLSRAYRGRGLLLAEQGELQRAIKDWNRAFDLDKTLLDIPFLRAKAWLQLGQPGKAWEDINLAADVKCPVSEVYSMRAHLRGEMWTKMGRPDHLREYTFEECEADLKLALELDPKNASAYLGMGILHSERGRFADAVKAFEKAIELNPAMKQACEKMLEDARKKMK